MSDQVNDWKPVGHDGSLKRPFPTSLFRPVDAVLISVVATGDPTVKQGLADVGSRCPEAWHSIDGVDSQAETVCLVANGKFQWCVDVALFLITADVQVVGKCAGKLTGGSAMDRHGS
jgi:hypothetical protein